MQKSEAPLHSEFMKRTVDEIRSALEQDGTFGPQNLNREDIGLLYSLGYRLYQSNDLEQAEVIFKRLILADSLDRKHWWGFGAVQQAQKKYEPALTSWSMCCLLDDEDPLAHFHAAECLLALGHKDEACKALDAAKDRIEDLDSDLGKKISALEDAWQCSGQEEDLKEEEVSHGSA